MQFSLNTMEITQLIVFFIICKYFNKNGKNTLNSVNLNISKNKAAFSLKNILNDQNSRNARNGAWPQQWIKPCFSFSQCHKKKIYREFFNAKGNTHPLTFTHLKTPTKHTSRIFPHYFPHAIVYTRIYYLKRHYVQITLVSSDSFTAF